MGVFNYKDERIKISLFLALIFVATGFFMSKMIEVNLNKANISYIKQNTKVVGYLYSKNEKLAEQIIPIMTGKEEGNYALGKEVMQGYSYTNNLNYKENPIFENIKNYTGIIILPFIFILISICGVIYILTPLYKDIKYLTKRAEEIVENKFYKENKRIATIKEGSLDKLFHKFNMMEERIKNSISLLYEEKINLKDIINDISHQLKTPITAISMYIDILQEYKTMEEEEVNIFIQSSKEQIERMEWLVLTLLKYARLESNVVKYNKEILDLTNTIKEVIEPLKIKAKEEEIEIIFNEEKQIIYKYDKNWLGEAISNIVKNAIEHTERDGKIKIKVEETEISIIVAIEDTGCGIEKEELKNIFKRFYKGEKSTNPTSIGIGLNLSRSIVRNHNGDIIVESEVGKGTIFYIKFLKTI